MKALVYHNPAGAAPAGFRIDGPAPVVTFGTATGRSARRSMKVTR